MRRHLDITLIVAVALTAATGALAYTGHVIWAAVAGAAAAFEWLAWTGGRNRAEAKVAVAATSRRALRDDTWDEATVDADRPREVIIGGVTYAVRPLTAPTLKRFTELGAPVFELQAAQSSLAGLMGTGGMTSDQVTACYDAMYAQLACLLTDPKTDDEPSAEAMGLYVPIQRLTELIQLLGPGGG